ncbi:NUDIX hydrolase, partial [Enterococcus faecalis]
IWWVSPQEALVKLKRGSHRWAVERWIEKNKN